MNIVRTVHVVVTGRVQGVFFRDYIKTNAKGLGISGFVRNLPTGKVEIIAQGERLDEFIRHCYRGSSASKVDEVKIDNIDEPEKFDDFKIM